MKLAPQMLLGCCAALLAKSSESLLMKKMMKGAIGSMMMYHPADDHHMMHASMPMFMPAMSHPVDASTMMMMMMMGTPMMPMNDPMKAQLSMEEMTSIMSRMKNRAQSAHEAADVKMKMHLRLHEQRSDDPKAPCMHRAAPSRTEPLEAPEKKDELRAPCSHGRLPAAPAAMEMKPMLSQPLIQMSPAAMPNGALMAPQMMPNGALMTPQMMPMSQYPMRSPATGQPMMSMMAPVAFPQNVVAMDPMSRRS